MISLCIPTFNEGNHLVRTIKSVEAVRDEIPTAEIVVADDGGTDDSVAECLRLWPKIRVARHPRPYGTSCAKALAADTARGDVLIFLDAHTKPQPKSLALLAAVAREHGVATPAVDGLDAETWQPRRLRSNGMYVDLLGNWHCLWIGRDSLPQIGPDRWQSYAIPGQSFAIRRDVYNSAGGWDRGLLAWGSDASLSLRLWCLGNDVVHVPSARVAHRFARSFTSYRPHWWEIFANRVRILRSLGTTDEIERFSQAMRSNGSAYRQAVEYTDQQNRMIPRLQGRAVRSLTEYADIVYSRESWTEIDGWLSLEEGRKLQQLAAGKRVLEIGSYRGRSTCCLAATAKRVVSVDPHDCATLPQKYRNRPSEADLRANLARCKVSDKVDVIVAPIQAVADQLEPDSFGLVFVDGDHSFAACRRDIELAQRIVSPGGAIAVHDYTIRKGVKAAVHAAERPFWRCGSMAIFSHPAIRRRRPAEPLSSRLPIEDGYLRSLGESRGIVTGANSDHWPTLGALVLQAATLGVPIAVADHGLAEPQRAELDRVGVRWIEHERPSLASAAQQKSISHINAWWKPWVCDASPFCQFLWIDSDAVLLTDITIWDKSPCVATQADYTADGTKLYEKLVLQVFDTDVCRDVLPSFTRINTGVVGFSRGDGLLREWQEWCLKLLQEPEQVNLSVVRDQSAFAMLLIDRTLSGKPLPAMLPSEWNWPADGLRGHEHAQRQCVPQDPVQLLEITRQRHPQAAVVHWLGPRKPWELSP